VGRGVGKMPVFRIKGKELIIRKVKKFGNGAIVYVPKDWLGEKVGIVRAIKEEENGNGMESKC